MSPNSWEQPLKIVFLLLLAALLGFVVWQIREIFTPLIIAGLIAYLFSPLILFLGTRYKLSRKVAANIVFFLAVAIIIILLVSILPFAISELGDVYQNLDASLYQYQTIYSQPIIFLDRPIINPGDVIKFLRDSISGDIAFQADQAMQLISSTSKGFLWFLVVVVTTYYLMTEWDRLKSWLISLAPDQYESDLWRLYGELRIIWLGYLAGQVRLMAILAILYSVAWALIGLPAAFVIGILAGFLNLVPEVGPALAAAAAILLALVQGSSYLPLSKPVFAVVTAVVYLIINNLKTIYIQPKVLGKSVTMHPGVVFVAIIAALLLEGFLGVLLVVPVLASIFIIAKYIRNKLLGQPAFPEST